MGKKRTKCEEPRAYCPKCDKVQKVIHGCREIPFREVTNICKTCHTEYPRVLGGWEKA